MSAEFLEGEGQPVPPLQPRLPSPSADSPTDDRLPRPPSGAAADMTANEQPLDPGFGLREDPVSNSTPHIVGDRAADNGAGGDFDPDAFVAFGNLDAETEFAAWEQNRTLAAALVKHASEEKASGGPPFLGWFADEAIPATTGRYRFALDREQLFAAVTHLAAIVGRPKRSTPTVRIALREDLCKLSVAGTRYEFAAIALWLKEAAAGFQPGAAPIAFTMPIAKLAGIVRTAEAGTPMRFELNGARSRLLVLERRLRRVPAGVPNHLTQPILSTPIPVGMLDPMPLAQGLSLLEHVVSTREGPREPGSWSRAYVRDGMVLATATRC
jgi:hypothetical protein